MSNGGYLVPPEDSANSTSSEIWEETWKRVDRFLPNLFVEIFPPPPPTAVASTPPEQQQQQNQQVAVPPPQELVAPVATVASTPMNTSVETKATETV